MPDPRFYKNAGPFLFDHVMEMSQAHLDPEKRIMTHDLWVHDVASLSEGKENDISFCMGEKYRSELEKTQISYCFISEDFRLSVPSSVISLLTSSPQRSFSKIAEAFYPDSCSLPCQPMDFPFIHPSAQIGENVILAPGVVIHERAEIKDNVHLGAHTVIGPGVVVGESSRIAPHVSIFYAILGSKVVIGPGTRIGQTGFGFVMDEKGHVLIPQLGRVLIEDFVEIGSNCTIDRGSLKDTIIGSGTRIDNLVHLAHNVVIGKGCVIVAQVGIAGSTSLGDFVILAGQAGLTDHLKIGSRARVAAQSGVMRDVREGDTIGGSPAVPIMEWRKQQVLLNKMVKKGR